MIVHVPHLDGRGGDNERDGDGIYVGRYIAKGIDEWRIDGSNSGWQIDWWFRIPEPSTPDELGELRMVIADLRTALTNSLVGVPLDAAQLLNDTADVSLKHRCYREEAECLMLSDQTQAAAEPVWAEQCRDCQNLRATYGGKHLRCLALVIVEKPLQVGWVADARKPGGVCGPEGSKFKSKHV